MQPWPSDLLTGNNAANFRVADNPLEINWRDVLLASSLMDQLRKAWKQGAASRDQQSDDEKDWQGHNCIRSFRTFFPIFCRELFSGRGFTGKERSLTGIILNRD
jgi:hypothetical protein